MRKLIQANVRLSRRLQSALRLPTDKTLWQSFEWDVQERIRALPDGTVVVDVGGGRRCVYHHALRPTIRLIAVDVSSSELALNPHADEKVVADISRELPLQPGSADLVVSRAVLEHVSDVSAAARHMAAVLKPGGWTLHLFPGRYSLFGIAARLLPFKPLLRALHAVMPQTIDQVEFDVHYDRGTPDQIERVFRESGFTDVSTQVTWAQPEYFEPLFPLFVIYSVYEALVRKLRLRSLASYIVVYARR